MAILIKRYANRKLYNTDTSRYITLKGISKLLAEGEEVRVVDKESGEDITQVALSQILVDSQRAKEDPSDTLLTQILSRGGDALYGAIKKSVDDATDGIGEFQDRFRSLVGQSESTGPHRGFPWEPRSDRERRSPFSRSDARSDARADARSHAESSGATGHGPAPAGSRHFEDAASDDRAHDEEELAGSGRAGWPRIAGLPDLRELIRSVVANVVATELDALDLPRNRDIRALNERLARVAEALERFEDERTDDPETRPTESPADALDEP